MTLNREKFRRVSAQNGGLSDFIAVAAALVGDKTALEALEEELLNARQGKSVIMPWQKAEAVRMAMRGETPTVEKIKIHKRIEAEAEVLQRNLIETLGLNPDAALKITLSGSAQHSIKKELFEPGKGFGNLRRIFNEQVREPLARSLMQREDVVQYIKENDDTVLDVQRTRTDGQEDFRITYQSPTYEVRQEAKRQKWQNFLNNGFRTNTSIVAPEKAVFRPKSRLG